MNGGGYKLCKLPLFVYCKKKKIFTLYKTTLYNLERAFNCKVKNQYTFPEFFFFMSKVLCGCESKDLRDILDVGKLNK